ncbi:hypothetical protein VKT23_005587 [Stygiomarasmius scandens]|uniref:Uncharacterized protein n=1 Tax=Marasmiellus scandens TaxID=2682957 RepID=A0ABR1JVA1_9AGAR
MDHWSLPLHAPTPRSGSLSAFPDFEPNFSLSPPTVARNEPMPMQNTFPTPSELLSELNGPSQPSTSDATSLRIGRGTRRVSDAKSSSRLVQPPETDSISSHEKKRQYLECLEQYVIYLHDQLNLIGVEPIALERVHEHKGLNSQSIRTLLVHMENTNRKLNATVLEEEQRFINLRDAYLQREAATASTNLSEYSYTQEPQPQLYAGNLQTTA